MVDRKMRVSRYFLVMGILILGLTLGMTCKKKNQPPGAPSIPSGPTSGRKGDTLRFSIVVEAADGDSVQVVFDWGDSTMSSWSRLAMNGDSLVMAHTWQRLGTFAIRAQARDAKEAVSVWSGAHQMTIASFSAAFGGSSWDEGNSVRQTSDGGYIIAGLTMPSGASTHDVLLVKADASGNKVWDKTFGGAGDDYGNSVRQTTDGGYIIDGITDSYGAGGEDAWLIKTDALGDEVWDKTFGGTGRDQAWSVQQTTDGGYIIAGSTTSFGGGEQDGWLVKTDASGNKVWDTTFGGTGFHEYSSVLQTSDGGYVITGSTLPDTSDFNHVWLVKTDASGNEVWIRTFGGSDDEWGESVQQTSDGGYIITGSTESQIKASSDVLLIKTDSSGNAVWTQILGEMDDDYGWSVQQTSDGGYVVAGETDSIVSGGIAGWLLNTDASGNQLWHRTFGGAGDGWCYSVQQTSDGGYVATGGTTAPGVSDSDLWLLKTDADGN